MAKSPKSDRQFSYTVAKEPEGDVQITFNLPWRMVKPAYDGVLKDVAEATEIPGFRKGNAPLAKVRQAVSEEKLISNTLIKLLPDALGQAIAEHKLKLAIYPKYTVLKSHEGEDWEIRALSCEIPEFKTGNYKQAIAGALRAKAIWTPGKGKKAEEKQPSDEETQQEIIKVLVKLVPVKVPKMLVEEEVNHRLSDLLSRIEKLGISLESYLGNTGKSAEALREEYRQQAHDAFILDFILDKIAEEEKIIADEKKVDEAIKASSADVELQKKLNTPEQRRIVASLLRRRACLDYLRSLV